MFNFVFLLIILIVNNFFKSSMCAPFQTMLTVKYILNYFLQKLNYTFF